MPYNKEFEEWWQTRKSKIRKNRRIAKHWAWVGWQAHVHHEEELAEEYGKHIKDMAAEYFASAGKFIL